MQYRAAFSNDSVTCLCLRLAVHAVVRFLPTDRHPATQKSFCVPSRRGEKAQAEELLLHIQQKHAGANLKFSKQITGFYDTLLINAVCLHLSPPPTLLRVCLVLLAAFFLFKVVYSPTGSQSSYSFCYFITNNSIKALILFLLYSQTQTCVSHYPPCQ